MSKLDKAKEFINILKVYLGILTALIMGTASGTAKLFNAHEIHTMFWIGIVTVVVLSFIFVKLAKYIHKKIDELEDM